MFDPTMKKKKKKKKVPLDLDALEQPNVPSNVDEKNENPPENENQDNVATEEKEDKEDTGTMYDDELRILLRWVISMLR